MSRKFAPNTGRKKAAAGKPTSAQSLLASSVSSTGGSLISADDYKPKGYCLDAKSDPFDPQFDGDVGALLRRSASVTRDKDWATHVVDYLVKTDKERYHYGELPEICGDVGVMVSSPVFIREAANKGRVYYIGPKGYLRRHFVKGNMAAEFKPRTDIDPKEVNPDFFLPPDWMKDLEGFIKRGDSILMIGPSGCGKTETAERIFEEYSQKLLIVDCNLAMTGDDLEGRTELVSGEKGTETRFHLAAPAIAARDGHGLLFNEADALQAEAAYALYSLLNRKPMNILRDAQIPIHSNFRVLGTQNTEGRGDTAGLFHGRAMQDESFLDRWDQYILVDYPSVADEVKILTVTTGLPSNEAIPIAESAAAIRNATRQGILMMSCGLRRTRKVAANVAAGYTHIDAWRFAVMNRATTEGRKTIEEILQRHYGSGKKGKK